ncbi:MAG: hypothetical protein NC082_09110 [Clostridiales bacterium]|nr:hypothetical protein [Clostridiales bacterium]
MKKIFYSFAVVAALGLVACGGNKANEEAAAEAPAEEVEVVEEATEVVADSASCCQGDSTCVAEAPAEAPAEAAE